MDNIDLKLLKVFDAVHRCGSLSKAADRLGLSQPAVSQALARLRERFDDPLFVRTPQGMEPTPHAIELLRLVVRAIAAIEDTMACHPVFDAARSRRLFRVGLTDIGQIVLLPQLLPHLRELAPQVQVEAFNISDQTPSMLETGGIDLAIGFIAEFDARFYQQALFDERFVCLSRAGHPRIRDTMSLQAYVAEEHVVVTTSGTGHLVVDRTVERLKIERKVALRIPSFLALSTIVGSTDLLCTVPRRAGLIMARHGEVSVFDPPFELPAYTVRQHWHERQQFDPGCQWLRRTVAALFGQGAGGMVAPQP
jgi:DNA-binding transcriptional LysR family regulator